MYIVHIWDTIFDCKFIQSRVNGEFALLITIKYYALIKSQYCSLVNKYFTKNVLDIDI